MLDVLRKFLRHIDSATPEAPAPLLAVAALLAEASHGDGEAAPAETAMVEAMLAALFDLDEAAAASLRRDGEAAAQGASDLVRFTRVVKTALPEADRLAVIEALWAVVLADGRRDPREDALMRRLAPLLAVSDRDSALARQRVERSAD